jgi:hypothetical protein
MKLKYLVITWGIALLGSSAQGATIAGWDFSQWLGSGVLSTNGLALQSTLNANYSSLDSTNNAGTESAALGRLFFDGQFGSTQVDPDPAIATFVPVGGSLASNLDAPTLDLQGNPIFGANPFDSLDVLASENQQYRNRLQMGATAPLAAVFAADLGSLGSIASDWRVSFGARSDAPSVLAVAFSTDGVAYVDAGNVTLGAGDTRYALNLTGLTGSRAFVRFQFAGSSESTQFIDNVAIEGALPEPAMGGLMLASALGLAALRARRV